HTGSRQKWLSGEAGKFGRKSAGVAVAMRQLVQGYAWSGRDRVVTDSDESDGSDVMVSEEPVVRMRSPSPERVGSVQPSNGREWNRCQIDGL
ncbi:hypothetical protein SARC_16568, partial [Sphaeroforma arctica JP610]